MKNSLCKYIHFLMGTAALAELDDVKTLCTYRILNKGVQVCDEDLGHPLVYNKTLVGVLASAAGCNGSPPVYTRVSEYQAWINKIIFKFSQSEIRK